MNDSNAPVHSPPSSRVGTTELAVDAVKQELLDCIHRHPVVVMVGSTGSGKTTGVPAYLLESGLYGRIACTQPRRVAAISVALRVAAQLGVTVGGEVGYAVRFEERAHPERTRLKYLTDGMLLREAVRDPLLTAYGVVMVDEVHERSISTDVLMGLLKRAIDVRWRAPRRPLRVLISSATLDARRLADFYGNAPVFEIPGRQYPVSVWYTRQMPTDHVKAAVAMTLQILSRDTDERQSRVEVVDGRRNRPIVRGDILVFLTGVEEIERASEMLLEHLQRGAVLGAVGQTALQADNLLTVPLHASLPPEQQMRVFQPTPPGKCKVVLATNVAETSITVPGIVYVVDSGLVKQRFGDRLQVVCISRASATQRSGRAGRTGPGHCYRLYPRKHWESEMAEETVPEMLRTDLAQVVLFLKSVGVDDLASFPFLDAPVPSEWQRSVAMLRRLGALTGDADALSDPIGKRMAAIPLEPRMARALLAADELGAAADLLSVFALLATDMEVFDRRGRREAMSHFRERFVSDTRAYSDHHLLAQVYAEWTRADYAPWWCRDHHLQLRTLRRARDIRDQLEAYLRRPHAHRADAMMSALLAGFADHRATLARNGLYRVQTSGENGGVAAAHWHIHSSSCVYLRERAPSCLLFHEMLCTRKQFLRCVSEVDEKTVSLPRQLEPEVSGEQQDSVSGDKKRRRRRQRWDVASSKGEA
ncbi:hypothetical protein CDCA_CDCA05G1526 [Cyanidium caldarium]|uniref:RNA helicase n=1 Tax=Cyanidium caldarium TaxID=2771 RepID=A0AAV9ITT3_CYACA|nr:hypothetical protein CDCA_CDCA05G1526 [Cyanidium caldarium]